MGAGLGEVQGKQRFQGETGLFMGSWETGIHWGDFKNLMK